MDRYLSQSKTLKIAILGKGAFGQALWHCIKKKEESCLWGYKDSLPLKEVLMHCDVFFLAIPTQAVASFLHNIAHIKDLANKTIIFCSKGIDAEKGLFQSEILQKILPSFTYGALGGPNLALDMMLEGQISFADIASPVRGIKRFFSKDKLFLKDHNNALAIQIAGALKNPFAIGYGLLSQIDASLNLKAAYLTVAFKEIQAFAKALQVPACAFDGFAGLGDLILTSTHPHSRNASFGRELFLPTKNPSQKLVEGLYTLQGLQKRCKEEGIDLPLAKAIYDIVQEKVSLTKGFDLMIKAMCV